MPFFFISACTGRLTNGARPTLLLLEQIVNIITVRRLGNLDRCKTAEQSTRSAVAYVMNVYARTHTYARACNRLANETFRFTKSSETREPRE